MENQKKKSTRQIKSAALPREERPHQRISISEPGRQRPSQESHHGTIRRRSTPDRSNITTTKHKKRLSKETKKLDKEHEELMKKVNHLEVTLQCETFLLESCKKAKEEHTDSVAVFEEEHKADRIEDAAIEKLQSDIRRVTSEIATNEKILERLQRNDDNMAKLVSLKMEVNRSPTSKCDTTKHQDVQSRESQQDLESSPGPVMPPTNDPILIDNTSDTNNTKVAIETSESNRIDYEDIPDSQLLLHLLTQLSEQTLAVNANSSITDHKLAELNQMITTTTKEMKEEEEKSELEVNDLKNRIDSDRKKAAFFKMIAKLHNLLKTADQDSMLDALGNKVTAIHQVCVDNDMGHFSTLVKLAQIELRVSSLLERVESIDKKTLERMRRIKDSDRNNRLKEEKRQKRLKTRADRSLGESKKISGRKLMPRFFPVEKIVVPDEDSTSPGQDFHAFLFSAN